MDRTPLIAHIIYSLSTGGLENGLVNIINRFPQSRYRHVIICMTTADDFSRRITAPGVEVIEMNKPPGNSLGFFFQMRRVLNKLQPKIIHSRNLAALEMQLCTIGMRGVKRVHGEHGREINDLDGSNRKYLLLRKCVRPLIANYIAVSKDLADWLVTRVAVRPQRVTQIYNGVDHEQFSRGTVKPLALLPQRWQSSDDMLVVGAVGRLTPVKDQQLLLQAVALLREADADIAARLRVIVVGDGPLREALQQQVQELALEDCVWLAGERNDVPELLNLMDLFTLPSLGEGVSNTVLEAMASGLPVVATAVGGNLELIEEGETGALFPVGDANALAHALRELLSDSKERNRRAENAQAFVSANFDWKNTVQSYLEVYDNLLGLSSGPIVLEAG